MIGSIKISLKVRWVRDRTFDVSSQNCGPLRKIHSCCWISKFLFMWHRQHQPPRMNRYEPCVFRTWRPSALRKSRISVLNLEQVRCPPWWIPLSQPPQFILRLVRSRFPGIRWHLMTGSSRRLSIMKPQKFCRKVWNLDGASMIVAPYSGKCPAFWHPVWGCNKPCFPYFQWLRVSCPIDLPFQPEKNMKTGYLHIVKTRCSITQK